MTKKEQPPSATVTTSMIDARSLPLFRSLLPWFLAALLLLSAAASAQAQTAGSGATANASILDDPFVRSQGKQGLDLLYDMKFAEAEQRFQQIDRRFPDHPIGPFLMALNTWWKILLDFSDTSHDEDFYAAMEKVIDRSDRLLKQDKQNFDAMFFKGAALGFRGRLRSNRREWFKAATDGKRAMDYVLDVAKKDPTNHDYLFGKGIYDYYAAVIPARYPFIKPVTTFLPKGDRARGLRQLERSAAEGYYIQTEAAYFLLQIYYLFEKNYVKSVQYVSWLRERHPAEGCRNERRPLYHPHSFEDSRHVCSFSRSLALAYAISATTRQSNTWTVSSGLSAWTQACRSTRPPPRLRRSLSSTLNSVQRRSPSNTGAV